MGKNPKISVIIPVYNVEKYLHKCIDSILSQTFTDFELLLIDDGSKDNSGIICDEYAEKDKRVRVFHKGNGGVSSARNMGLDNAIGEWIAFVDSDDWVEKNLLKYALIKNIEHGTDVFFSAQEATSINGDEIIDKEEAIKRHLNFSFPSSLCLGLYKKEVIEYNHLSHDIHHWEDYEYQLRLLFNVKKIYLSNKSFYHYTQRIGSANHVDVNDKVFTCLKIPSRIKMLSQKNKNITKVDYYNSLGFFSIQVLFSILRSQKVDEDYYKRFTIYCRSNLFCYIRSKKMKKSYLFLLLLSGINTKITYILFNKKVKNLSK